MTPVHIVMTHDNGPCEHADADGICQGRGWPEEGYIVGTDKCMRYWFTEAPCTPDCTDALHESLIGVPA